MTRRRKGKREDARTRDKINEKGEEVWTDLARFYTHCSATGRMQM
jgi:hypothetical protein